MHHTEWNKRLLASTRGQIVALLRAENRTVNELAAALNLTDNAVRAHLLSLGRDGLVKQQGTRRGIRKPHTTYSLSAEAEHIFPKAYGLLLNHFVSVISRRLGPQALRTIMRQVGCALARDQVDTLKRRPRRERIKAAIELLNALGGLAKFTENGGKQFIHGRNGCPLAAVTTNYPQPCLIVESMLSKIIGERVRKCCEYGETPRCCFELSGK
jgi:DeoR family transcriptional regulator, suf operon transcriptional repressor